MRKSLFAILIGCAACDAPVQLIPSPERVGLIAVRPYPNQDGNCVVIGENEVTSSYLDDASLLIGCPRALTQDLAQRRSEGARVVAYVERWALLSQPIR